MSSGGEIGTVEPLLLGGTTHQCEAYWGPRGERPILFGQEGPNGDLYAMNWTRFG
jgi:hypothetical protein